MDRFLNGSLAVVAVHTFDAVDNCAFLGRRLFKTVEQFHSKCIKNHNQQQYGAYDAERTRHCRMTVGVSCVF